MGKVDKEGYESNNGAQVLSGREPGAKSRPPRCPGRRTAMPETRFPIMSQRRMTVSWMLGFCQGSSPSMLERLAGYDRTRIPSSIFASRQSNPAEWSVVSNESLFSIHTGNNSFSRDHTAFLLYKSGELTKLDEAFSVPTPLPPVSETLSLQRDSISSSVAANQLKLLKQREPSSEGKSPILSKSSGKGNLSPSMMQGIR